MLDAGCGISYMELVGVWNGVRDDDGGEFGVVRGRRGDVDVASNEIGLMVVRERVLVLSRVIGGENEMHIGFDIV